MSEHWQWLEHKGKRILFANFAGIKDEETYLQAIADLEREILRQPKGQVIPLLLDVTDTRLTKAVSNRGKQMMETAKAKGVPDGPAALIGLSGLQKAVVMAIQLIRPDTRMFESPEEAKDWIVNRLK
jgi:hypothetical protein